VDNGVATPLEGYGTTKRCPELVGKFRDTGLVEVKKEVLNREQGPFEGAACSWTARGTITGMKSSLVDRKSS